MNSDEPSQNNPTAASVMIHWVLFASVFIYGGIAFALSRVMDKAMLEDPFVMNLLVIVLSAVSLGVIAAVLFVRKFWLSPESLVNADRTEKPEAIYQRGVIMQGGLAESIGIYGLLLSMFSNSFLIFLPYAAISISLFLFFRPSREDFEQRLERAGWSSDSMKDTSSG